MAVAALISTEGFTAEALILPIFGSGVEGVPQGLFPPFVILLQATAGRILTGSALARAWAAARNTERRVLNSTSRGHQRQPPNLESPLKPGC